MKSPLIFVPSRSPEYEFHLPPVLGTGYMSWKLLRGGKVIRSSPLQPNLLVNTGLDRLVTSSFASGMYAACGTGSNAPLATDAALQAQVGTRVFQSSPATGYVAIGGAIVQDYQWRTLIFTFLEANANGNLTEFGTFDGAAGPMFSRQLFKDIGGVPTTIIKTNQDQLQVTYEYRAYPPLVDVNLPAFAISGDAITSDITIRPMGVSTTWANAIFEGVVKAFATAWEDNSLVARTSVKPQGVSGTFHDQLSTSNVFSTYVNGNFFIDETIKWEPGFANWATGIGGFGLYGYGGALFLYQAALTTKIPKTSVKRTTVIIRRQWGRFP